MFRAIFGSLLFVLVTGVAAAADVKSGTVTKVDTEKNTITVKVDGKDQTFKVAKDASVSQLTQSGRRGRTLVEQTLADGLKSVRTDRPITFTLEKKDDTSVVASIRLSDEQQQQRRRRR